MVSILGLILSMDEIQTKNYAAQKKIGGGQNTDPLSMDYPDWTIPMD